MTAETAATSIGTVWVLRQGVVLCCFRAVLDAEGRILRTTLGEAEDQRPTDNRDHEIAERLRRRYGPDLELRVLADAGASFDRFQDDLRHHRRPTVPASTAGGTSSSSSTTAPGQPSLFST